MDAATRDARNPLAGFRDRFVVTDPGVLYVDGNSLGRQPRAAAELARRLVDEQWADRLIRGWGEGWMDLPARIGDKIGRVVGARPGEVLVADSTSVNLYKLALAAVLARPGRSRIVTDSLNFPSDGHVLGEIARATGSELVVVESADGIHGPVDGLVAALDEDVALLSLSATAYRSGYSYDVPALTAAAHDAGALTLWDLSHTVGSVPVDLTAANADLAVGCTYKYLNGGPGAPAFLYIRREITSELENPVPGWMGSADPFDFDLAHCPAVGARAFLTGTPPVLSTALVEPGVDLVLEAGMDTIRAVSLELTEYLLHQFDLHLAPRGFSLQSPRGETRGSHLTIGHPHGLAIDQALISEQQVIPDFRPPDGIRIGATPLYVGFEDLAEVVRRICVVVDTRAYERYEGHAVAVT